MIEIIERVAFMEFSIVDWIIPIGLGLVIGIFFATRKQYDYSKIVSLNSNDFAQSMRKGQLIDLRKEDLFEQGRISGARNFPKMSVFGQLHKLRKDQAVFLYDETASLLAKRVAKKLIRKGFQAVYVLEGGIKQWPYIIKNN